MNSKNGTALLYALFHHAQELAPIAGVLSTGILLELEPRGWSLDQIRNGAQSYVLRRDGREFHFRLGREHSLGKKVILVKDAYHNGGIVYTIRTRLDALHFIQERITES